MGGVGVEEESTPPSSRGENLFDSGTSKVGATGTDWTFLLFRLLTLGSDCSPLEVLVALKTVRAAVAYDRPATGVAAGGPTVLRASWNEQPCFALYS